ncbi:MAG: diguanylate cyclase [Afipia sp.]|nr:diguanylate cyclase [Afipia sp.]MCW5701130.1 diguanylate cyclase [Bradyrhizobium sp.]TXH17032.1 MAG: diguanylate cyclase [Gammaproteobacteria bacterium]
MRQVADRLRTLSRSTDYIARLGGDEFAIIVTDRHDQEGLVGYARRLIAGISEPFDLSGQIVRIGVSIGVGTTTPFGPQETTELRRWPAGSFSVPLP